MYIPSILRTSDTIALFVRCGNYFGQARRYRRKKRVFVNDEKSGKSCVLDACCFLLGTRPRRWGMRPKRQSRPSAPTCINTSSRLRSRLVAAILDSRDGLSIRACVCAPISRFIATGYRGGVYKGSRCARGRRSRGTV